MADTNETQQSQQYKENNRPRFLSIEGDGLPITTCILDQDGQLLRRVHAVDIHIETGKATQVILTMNRVPLHLKDVGINEYRERILDAFTSQPKVERWSFFRWLLPRKRQKVTQP